MGSVGLERIRELYKGVAGASPVVENDPDGEAIGVIQDLLIEHGFLSVPSHREEKQHERFGKTTSAAVRNFFGIKAGKKIILDSPKIVRLIDEPPKSPRGRLGRLSIKLEFPSTKQLNLLSLVSIFEGGFATLNRNNDKAGLSYGLIQWAQKPGRLREIVKAFSEADQALFKQTFGDTAGKMLDHISTAPKFGVDDNGATTKPEFDLIRAPWDERFINAGKKIVFQKKQVELGLVDFSEIVTFVQRYSSEKIKSQRGIAFMVDLSNQFGRGDDDSGAKGIYNKVKDAATDEPDLLQKMKQRSVDLMPEKLKKSTEDRRAFFCTSRFLSNGPF